jgi:Peptidase S46
MNTLSITPFSPTPQTRFRRYSCRFAIAALFAACTPPALALDGKWTPAQVLDIDAAWLKRQGLTLPPSALWDAKRGTGLLTGTVNIGGCSGAFVSATGLIVTNHHCLFGAVQEHSTPQRDLMTNGFLARTQSEELSASTLRVEIPKRFTDVSAQVLLVVPAGAQPQARLQAIDSKRKALVAECQKQADIKCKVAVFDDGTSYILIESIELRDVRLVYAPPRAIGEYGGEIDNWSWPRHTGDFAIARAYASANGTPADHAETNAPYASEFFFPLSKDGVDEGDFVMVLGYPGITYRALIADEMRERRERFFVRREDLFGEWIAILEHAGSNDAQGKIALSANLKGIHNRYKNAQGQIAGLDRGKIIERQRAQDAATIAWGAKKPRHTATVAAHAGLREVLAEREATWERDFLLNLIPLGAESPAGGIPPLPKALFHAATLAYNAEERAKPEASRATGFADADQSKIRERLRREQSQYFAPADQRVFAALVRRALALPADQRIAAVDARFGGMSPEAIERTIAQMYVGSAVLDADKRDAMLGESADALNARKDSLLDFGRAWASNVRALRERERDWNARAAVYRPAWRRAVAAHAGTPIAPDANGTLRISFAHVKGYAPRDGLRYTPFTTLAGVLEKHTGQEPFDAPATVRTAAALQPTLPVNFLADGDTSGGNSGSPVIDGRGALVGINFDRVWENVAGDFGFNPAVSRNISVDIRYLLWMLRDVENADALLRELGIVRGIGDKR